MTVIVRDAGFVRDDLDLTFTPLAEVDPATVTAVEIRPEEDVAALLPYLDRLVAVRVLFPAFSDGRGFTHGRRLRALGYKGRLRAAGHVIADQYAMVRRSGFDEAEIDETLAARQPEEQWRFRADWTAHDYQGRLRA